VHKNPKGELKYKKSQKKKGQEKGWEKRREKTGDGKKSGVQIQCNCTVVTAFFKRWS